MSDMVKALMNISSQNRVKLNLIVNVSRSSVLLDRKITTPSNVAPIVYIADVYTRKQTLRFRPGGIERTGFTIGRNPRLVIPNRVPASL